MLRRTLKTARYGENSVYPYLHFWEYHDSVCKQKTHGNLAESCSKVYDKPR